MAKDRAKILNQIVRKIPLFSGLSPSQIDILLKVCHAQPYEAGDVVCASGTPAEEMYILLSGELAVVTDDGTRVATLSPVTTVGELGLVTHQNRGATVETLSACNLLIIRKMSFEIMLQSNLEIQARILRNIVDIVADKISNDNIRTSEHVKVTDRLKRQVRELEHRVMVSTEMLVEETGTELAQVQMGIDKRLLEQDFKCILLVDDEAGIRSLLRDALHEFDTVEADSGEAALAAVEAQMPDLVVTDIHMSGMDGVELLGKIQEQYPDLHVLAISGVVDADQMREHPFDGFLEKPLDIEKFRELVRELVEEE